MIGCSWPTGDGLHPLNAHPKPDAQGEDPKVSFAALHSPAARPGFGQKQSLAHEAQSAISSHSLKKKFLRMFKTMGSTFTKFVFGLAALTGLNVAGQTADIKGFWSMSGERAWSEQELDRAFDLFKRLKSEHGEQFSLVVVDLHKQGQPSPSGEKTAQILVKVYVTPPSQSISTALTNVGMVFIPEP